jgi:hypothetical protein
MGNLDHQHLRESPVLGLWRCLSSRSTTQRMSRSALASVLASSSWSQMPTSRSVSSRSSIR